MDTDHTAVQPQELARAEAGWATFVRVARIVCIVFAVTMILLAIFLL